MKTFANPFRTPPAAPSRQRAVFGFFAACLLAALVVGNVVALTLFLWSATAAVKVFVVLGLLWLVSLLALYFVFRLARHARMNWRSANAHGAER